MRRIETLPFGLEALLWGPDCGFFIGTRYTDKTNGDQPYVDNENNLRDDDPEVTLWEPLPDTSDEAIVEACVKCGSITDDLMAMVTPLGWRYACMPPCGEMDQG